MSLEYNQKHFLQSSAWASFSQALKKEVFTEEGSNWSYQAIFNNYKYISELYVPYGPWAKDQDSLLLAIKSLIELARRQKASYIRVEPYNAFMNAQMLENIKNTFGVSLQKSPRQVQPNYTSVIDLSISEEEIISHMNASSRNLHRNFYKKGFVFTESLDYKDIAHIVNMLKNTNTGQAVFHNLDYMMKQAKALMDISAAKIFFIKDQEGEILAGSMIFTGPDIWYLAHASSSAKGKALYLNQPLISNIIIMAKLAKAKYFDLYGVANPDNPQDKLQHISKFKQQFGGSIQHISTTYDIVLDKNKYSRYRLILKLSSLKKQILLLLKRH